MNSGTAHLIATGPPFNKNKNFHVTPDSLASGARFTKASIGRCQPLVIRGIYQSILQRTADDR